MRIRPSAPPRSSDLRLRGALLMPLCALAVHQLRYLLAFGSTASARLAHDGHAYLSSLEPFVLLSAALALGGFAGTVARALQTRKASFAHAGWRRKPAGAIRRALPLWALCAGTLLALYCGQELCEGLLFPGHAAGLAGIFGHSGWTALPLSLLLGAALAATLRGTEALVERIARRRATRRCRAATCAPARRRPHLATCDWRLEPQSGLVAGRAPPVTLSLT